MQIVTSLVYEDTRMPTCRWLLWFFADNPVSMKPYVSTEEFAAKPTKKQVRKLRRKSRKSV